MSEIAPNSPEPATPKSLSKRLNSFADKLDRLSQTNCTPETVTKVLGGEAALSFLVMFSSLMYGTVGPDAPKASNAYVHPQSIDIAKTFLEAWAVQSGYLLTDTRTRDRVLQGIAEFFSPGYLKESEKYKTQLSTHVIPLFAKTARGLAKVVGSIEPDQ